MKLVPRIHSALLIQMNVFTQQMNVFRTNIHFGLCTTSPDYVSVCLVPPGVSRAARGRPGPETLLPVRAARGPKKKHRPPGRPRADFFATGDRRPCHKVADRRPCPKLATGAAVGPVAISGPHFHSCTARFRRHDLPESGIRIRFPFPDPRFSQSLSRFLFCARKLPGFPYV